MKNIFYYIFYPILKYKMPARSRSTRTISKPKSTVCRSFYDDRLDKKNPRLTVIAYKHDLKTGETTYGASLFKLEKKQEIERTFGKKQNLKRALLTTALKRLEMKPVQIKMKTKSVKDLHQKLRLALYKHGAYSKKIE